MDEQSNNGHTGSAAGMVGGGDGTLGFSTAKVLAKQYESKGYAVFTVDVGDFMGGNSQLFITNGEVLFAKNDGVLHCLVGTLALEPAATDEYRMFKLSIGLIATGICVFALAIVLGRKYL